MLSFNPDLILQNCPRFIITVMPPKSGPKSGSKAGAKSGKGVAVKLPEPEVDVDIIDAEPTVNGDDNLDFSNQVDYNDPNAYPEIVKGSEDALPTRWFRFRQYREGDIPAICELMNQTLSEAYTTLTYRVFTDRFPDMTFVCVRSSIPPGNPVDDQEGEIVGAAICNTRLSNRPEEPKPLVGYVGMIATDVSARNQGVAAGLMLAALRVFSAHGCVKVALETELSNLGAIRFYEGVGFSRTKSMKGYYLGGQDAVGLKLILHPDTDWVAVTQALLPRCPEPEKITVADPVRRVVAARLRTVQALQRKSG